MAAFRTPNILHRVSGDLYYLAPIPVIWHQVKSRDIEAWHEDLVSLAREQMEEPILEVPDVRHIHDLGRPPNFNEPTWAEEQLPAVGVWHRVPTNGFLGIDASPVHRLRELIESQYFNGLVALGISGTGNPWISESWIQFYKDGDYKVLHNHERYGPPYPSNRWAGAYYVDDGQPDPTMPYAGVFSFSVRNVNHYVRPRPGMLLIWPADILHQVHPFYGARQRVVINFNINTRADAD